MPLRALRGLWLAWALLCGPACPEQGPAESRLEALEPPAERIRDLADTPTDPAEGGVIAVPPAGLLTQAIQGGDVEEVRKLLDGGADPDARDGRGQTALLAFFSGRNWRSEEPVLKLLLARGADPNLADTLGRTPLHAAIERGKLKLIGHLLAAGARPGIADAEGRTPLHRAAELERLEEAGLLLAHGADPLARDKKGMNPLHLAIGRGSFWLARLLADRPECLAARDAQGHTALHLAVEKRDLDLAGMLVERGADPLLEDQAGERPLDWLARRCASFLEERKEQPASVSDHVCLRHPGLRSAALFLAAAEGFAGAVDLLLAKQASITDMHGFLPDLGARATALHAAAWGGHGPVLRRLLAAGARPDTPDANGWTALHTAVWRGNYLEAEALLQAGASRELRTRSGATPLDLAREQENEAIVRLLQRRR